MLEELPVTRARRDTEAQIVFGRSCKPWSEADNARLRRIAAGVCTSEKLLATFPDRTVKSAKKQLSRIREEMGIKRGASPLPRRDIDCSPIMLDPNDEGLVDTASRTWRKACERGNRAYLAALERAGYLQRIAA